MFKQTLFCVGAVFLITFTPATAQDTPRYYVGADPGRIFSSEVRMRGTSNDRSSVCDEFINPLYELVSGCTDANRGAGDEWTVPFEGAGGYEASIVAGLRLHRMFRVEAEYYTRTSEYGQQSDVQTARGVDQTKLNDEIAIAREWLGTVSSQGLMANMYIDMPVGNGRAIPFLGLGAGLSRLRVDYGSVWSRNADPNAIATGSNQSNADEIANNLASTTSSGHDTLEDTQASVQLLLGMKIPIRESVSVNFRARWMIISDFAGTIVWDPLRGHPPNLRRDGSEPVSGQMSTDDFSYLGISIGMHHHF